MAGSSETRRQPSWLILSLGFGGLADLHRGGRGGHAGGFSDGFAAPRPNRGRRFWSDSALSTRFAHRSIFSGTYVRDFLLSPDSETAKARGCAPGHTKARDPQRPGCVRAPTGGRRNGSRFATLRERDRRLLAGARRHRRVVAAGTESAAILVLLQRIGAAPHGHAADRGPHRFGERAGADAFGGAVGRLGG